MRFSERKDNERRLRRIVLHSADVATERVASYIKWVAQHGSGAAKQMVITEYQSLAQYLAKDYVDFLLEVLIKKPEETDHWNMVHGPRLRNHEDLGIEQNFDPAPPSPTNGPFLRLLRENEDEGLRLIHTLTNTATKNWCELERKPVRRLYESQTKRTPLPIIIHLASGDRSFWGDQVIYRWFRPGAGGPKPVMSALMALEVWMEQQVESGRDAGELFEKVLSKSECAGVLGVCAGIALAYPLKCLYAALPIASSPTVWTLDVKRYVLDLSGAHGGDFFRYRSIFELQAKRDKRPQRQTEIRHLAYHYLFSEDESLRARFEGAVARFTDELPFAYEEEREDPHAVAALIWQMEIYKRFGDRTNYRYSRTEHVIDVEFIPPTQLQVQADPAHEYFAVTNKWLRLCNWSHSIVKEGKSAEGMAIEEAIKLAQELQRPGDFVSHTTVEGKGIEDSRLEAIAGVAAASIISDFNLVKGKGHLDWCRQVLLKAARATGSKFILDSREGGLPFDPRAFAARGLGALVVRGEGDLEVRTEVLRLVSDPHYSVVGAVFRGLQDAWNIDEVLCRNALSLGLSLCMAPSKYVIPLYSSKRSAHEARWADKLVKAHVRNMNKEFIPQLTRIKQTKKISFLWKLAEQIVGNVPLNELIRTPERRNLLFQLLDDLMVWTVTEHTPKRDRWTQHISEREHPHLELWEWNRFLFGWACRLMNLLSLEESRQHILAPIKGSWRESPALMAELMQNHLFTNIGIQSPPTSQAQDLWREMCAWVLDDLQQQDNQASLFRDDEADAVSLIIFVRHNMCCVDKDWPHGLMFSDIIDQWVSVIGGNADAYNLLLIMLRDSGSTFFFQPALRWLQGCAHKSVDYRALWHKHDNGVRTAKLLQRMWHRDKENIRYDATALQMYSSLVDRLVAVGIPLASLLQQRLEQRG